MMDDKLYKLLVIVKPIIIRAGDLYSFIDWNIMFCNVFLRDNSPQKNENSVINYSP